MENIINLNKPEEARKYFENKLAFTTGPAELNDLRRKAKGELNIIDVRAREDYEEGHVPGAQNLPEDQWESLKGLSKDKPNVVYCYSQACHMAARAAAFFASRGFPVVELEGGFGDYREHEFEIETGERKSA